jgi:ADP-ribose pyrophosphatase YjhB (NUDIX family)
MPGLALAVNVAVVDDGRVLLTRREDFHVWCLPGGQVDEGESLGEAALREVEEETGLIVRLDRLVGLYSRPSWGGPHTLVVFAATRIGGELAVDPREVVEAAYFEPHELPEPLLWGQRERLADLFAGHGGSIVRTHDRSRPTTWPRERAAQYALRDDSGLPRAEFYVRHAAGFGDETGRREA